MERRTDTDTLRDFINAVEKLAFEMPPPNPYTPQLMMMCIVARNMSMDNNNQRAERTFAEEICSEQLAAGWDGHIDVETEIIARAILAERLATIEMCAKAIDCDCESYCDLEAGADKLRGMAAAIRSGERT